MDFDKLAVIVTAAAVFWLVWDFVRIEKANELRKVAHALRLEAAEVAIADIKRTPISVGKLVIRAKSVRVVERKKKLKPLLSNDRTTKRARELTSLLGRLSPELGNKIVNEALSKMDEKIHPTKRQVPVTQHPPMGKASASGPRIPFINYDKTAWEGL